MTKNGVVPGGERTTKSRPNESAAELWLKVDIVFPVQQTMDDGTTKVKQKQ